MKKLLTLIMMFALLISISGCEKKEQTVEKKSIYEAEIVVKDHGIITVELYRDKAPKTVDHFIELAEGGWYDNTYITRMQAEFVLQAGDGCKNDSTVDGEFSSNGFTQNDLEHTKGVLSMARTSDPNSASSQFFIVLSNKYQSSLDGNYAAFGKVIGGWDTINGIVNSITSSDFQNNYYGTQMGFLKESSYFVIETVRIK